MSILGVKLLTNSINKMILEARRHISHVTAVAALLQQATSGTQEDFLVAETGVATRSAQVFA
ncbi:hypothetical protein SMRU11_29235 [Sinorhizobium meliloti RU11/001]|nr:hypothetical protein SMRU11_29235 [Sinorhizobium meliloti RU11/001]